MPREQGATCGGWTKRQRRRHGPRGHQRRPSSPWATSLACDPLRKALPSPAHCRLLGQRMRSHCRPRAFRSNRLGGGLLHIQHDGRARHCTKRSYSNSQRSSSRLWIPDFPWFCSTCGLSRYFRVFLANPWLQDSARSSYGCNPLTDRHGGVILRYAPNRPNHVSALE